MTETRTFEVPEAESITNLMVESLGETTLKPGSVVICRNRGRKDLYDSWDGNHLRIPPGIFKTEYGAALHFQRRLIVPGTRNLEVGGFISWIAILGSDDGRVAVDHPDNCVPFTDEELQEFGERIEGLSPEGRGELKAMKTSGLRASSRTQGAGGSFAPVVDARRQASEAAAEAAASVFEPATEPRATQIAEREAAAERGADAVEVEALPQPRPMRGRNR